MPCDTRKKKQTNKGVLDDKDMMLHDKDMKLSELQKHVAKIEMEHIAMKSELNNLKVTIQNETVNSSFQRVVSDFMGEALQKDKDQDRKLNDLESRVSNSDKALERALKNLESHVGRLEKVQQQPTQYSLPPPPLAPPLPTRANSPTRTKQTNTNPDASVKTQPPNGKRFGMSPNNRNETLESPKNDTLKHPEKGKPPEPTAPTKKGKKNQDKQGGMTVTKEIEQLDRFKKLREEADKTTMESMGKGPVWKKIGKKLQIFGKQNRYTV